MKNLTLYLITICSSFIFSTSALKAQFRVDAGDMTYEWVADSTYKINCILYLDCSGTLSHLPPSMQICLSNTCFSGNTIVNLPMNDSGFETPPPCPSYPTKCTNPSSSYNGFKKWTYQALITLPYRCNYWKAAVYYEHLYAGFSNIPATPTVIYFEARINNTGSYQGNSSPVYNTVPIFPHADSKPVCYNNNITDINGDSVAIEVINPLTSNNSNCSSPANIPLNTTSPPLSIPGNPFQTNNTFTCDSKTGQIYFTQSAIGNNLLAIKASEFRGGIWIGSTMRYISFHSYGIPSANLPTGNTLAYTGTINTSSGIAACKGSSFGFSVDIKSPDPTAVLSITDNYSIMFPGSSVTYSTQNDDSIRATFSYTPQVTGSFNLVFTVYDKSCKPPGLYYNSSVVVPITIYGKPLALNDTAICAGNTVTLGASGGNNYLWSVISGTAGSLSCTSCASTNVTPTTTSAYLLTSGASAFCGNNKDTVTVTVNAITTPSVSISASPGTYVTQGTNVTFSATASNCTNPIYLWKRNGNVISGVTGPSFTSSTLANNDKITCSVSCSDPCPNPANPTSNQITMQVIPANISHRPALITPVTIYPNPGNGVITLESVSTILKCKLDIINATGKVVHHEDEIIISGKKQLDLSYLPSGVYIVKINETVQRITISK